ncbi:hypothetical protein [Vagococcus luciliae]|uniref:Uncharacterized protein n=1 Tax=Vagococcus luciliae TaxID=2920380 RepID=A0ABY5NYL8_9ENTE|nr:hypothetical protein [Vagococcus luciliae]UUV98747.1 hypothetical protein G314FT_09010 [Vagococcus luciliae]
MTVNGNYWYLSEHLINVVLPVILFIVAIILFILFGIISSTTNSKKIYKIIGLTFLITTICISTIFLITKDYRKLISFETNANRKIKMAVLHYQTRPNDSSNRASLYDVDKTLNLPFYKKEVSTEQDSLKYLGKDDVFYYFTDNKDIYRLDISSNLIQFNPVNQVAVTKEYAVLIDASFTSIGFKEKIGPGISSIIVPISEENVLYQPKTKTYDLLN